MILGLIFAVAGLIVLAFAADHFVAGAARLAVFYDVSPVVIGAVLIVLGVALMLLAPESVGGLVLLGLAIVLEFVGLALERRGDGA